MPNEGYHSVTIRDETYDILESLSKNLNKSIPETVHSLGTMRYPQSFQLNFRTEYTCLDCGHRSGDLTDKCPICKGPMLARYIKLKEGINQIVPEGNRVSQRPKGRKKIGIGPRHNHDRIKRPTLFQRISSVLRG